MSSAKERGELTITLRMKGRPVVLVGEGELAEEQRGLLKRAGAFIVAEGSKATFAVVVDDPAAVSRLKVRGCLVYAVGHPELSDFTLAMPVPASKPSRKAGSAPAARVPAPEPIAAVAPSPEFRVSQPAPREPRAPKPPRAPKIPRERAPCPELRLPQISFAPIVRAGRAAGRLTRTMWSRLRASISPAFRMFMPVTQTVASNIQARIDRARERPISLDLALVKGGLLDHQPESPSAEQPEPSIGDIREDKAPPANASASPPG